MLHFQKETSTSDLNKEIEDVIKKIRYVPIVKI